MSDIGDMPGHLARRFQQIAVALFHAEVGAAGSDLTPVQFAALTTILAHPGIDQATLAGLIAYDRTTITGVVDRLAQKGFITRAVSGADRRARVLAITDAGRAMLAHVRPAVLEAQKLMLSGLEPAEGSELMRLMRKAIDALNEQSRAPLRDLSSERGEQT